MAKPSKDEKLPEIIISTENNEGKSEELTDMQTDTERKTEKEEREENSNNLAGLRIRKKDEERIAKEAKIAEDKSNESADLKETVADNEKTGKIRSSKSEGVSRINEKEE